MPGKKKLSGYHLIVFGALLLSAIGLKLWSYHLSDATVVLKGETLHVMVAKTPMQQFRGLAGRDNLGRFDGMIFVFPKADRVGFVMRDMRFSIDIVWFSNGRVVDIAPNVPVEPVATEAQLKVYYPRKEADLVLELPAGWAASHGLVIGDQLTAP